MIISHDTNAPVRSYWDAAADSYDALPGHGLFSERERVAWRGLLARVISGDRLRVADVGTGTGFFAFRLAELGHDVVGVDLSTEMLDIARREAARQSYPIRFLEGSADLHDVDSGPLDAIVCRHVVWTLPEPERTLAAWRARLEPGGRVVAIDGTWFEGNRALIAAGELLGRLRRTAREHGGPFYATVGPEVFPLMRTRSPQPMHNAFERAGLVDVRSEWLDGIEVVERETMSFADRLARRWRRYMVEGSVAS